MDTTLTDVHVECYAGYRSEEEPRRFVIWGRTVEVVEIVDRWLSPDHRYFKLQGSDGGMYILRHDHIEDCWELTVYNKYGAERNLS